MGIVGTANTLPRKQLYLFLKARKYLGSYQYLGKGKLKTFFLGRIGICGITNNLQRLNNVSGMRHWHCCQYIREGKIKYIGVG